jgi:hypothetical protein
MIGCPFLAERRIDLDYGHVNYTGIPVSDEILFVEQGLVS